MASPFYPLFWGGAVLAPGPSIFSPQMRGAIETVFSGAFGGRTRLIGVLEARRRVPSALFFFGRGVSRWGEAGVLLILFLGKPWIGIGVFRPFG